MSENTTGLFKWSIDALLRRKEESPSKKYKQPEHTEEKIEEDADNFVNFLIDSPQATNRTRSMSLNGLDPAFYQRYELINDVRPATSFSGIKTSSKLLMSPIKLQNNDNGLCTDTFFNKKGQHDKASENPQLDDTNTSLLAKLLNKEKLPNETLPCKDLPHITRTSTIPIPGKFPKNNKDDQSIPLLNRTVPHHNVPHHVESLNQIHNDLSINKSLLLQINEYVNKLIEEKTKFQIDYNQVKLELIHEMKQCQKIMDRYTDLTKRHKELKIISSDTFKMNNQLLKIQNDQKLTLNERDQRIRQLEIQINKLNIKLDEKDITINLLKSDLNSIKDQLIDDRNYYELEISKLNHSLNALDEINIINQHPTYV
ncbi:spindle pole component Bbp1p [Monosporozyma servazzii]